VYRGRAVRATTYSCDRTQWQTVMDDEWKLRDRRHRVYWLRYRFPEPCGHSGYQPSPKHIPGGRCEVFRFRQQRRGAVFRHEHPVCLSCLQIVIDHDDGEEPQRQLLLAVWKLRRGVERVPPP
jgi:hypothetical protein